MPLGQRLLRGLPVLIVICNALSAEVEMLDADSPNNAFRVAPISDSELEKKTDVSDQETKHAMQAGVRKQLAKDVSKAYKEVFGTDLAKGEVKEHFMDFTKKERNAMDFFHSMKKEWEGMTGEKLEVNSEGLTDDQRKGKMHELITSMSKLEKVMFAGKPVPVPKQEDMPKQVHNMNDVATTLDEIKKLRDFAFSAIPVPSGSGLKKNEGTTDGMKPLDTPEEQARQIAVEQSEDSRKAQEKSDKDKAAADFDKENREDAAREATKESMEREDAKKEGGVVVPSGDDSPDQDALEQLSELGDPDSALLQVDESQSPDAAPAQAADVGPDTTSNEADTSTKQAQGDGSQPKTKKEADEKVPDAQTSEVAAKAAEAAKAANVKLPQVPLPKDTNAPAGDWNYKATLRLDDVQSKIEKLKAERDELEAQKDEDAANEGPRKEAAEKREARDAAAAAAAKNETNAKLNQTKTAAEEAKGIHEIDCPNNMDLECLRKRAMEINKKAKKARHLAYDMQRKAAMLVLNGSNVTAGMQQAEDWAAEQEKVFAAFMAGEADRANEDMATAKRAFAANEVRQKSKKDADMKIEKKAEKMAGKEVKKEATALEKKNNDKLVAKAEQKAEVEAKVIEQKIEEKEKKKAADKEEAKEKAEEEVASKKDEEAQEEQKKEEDAANREEVKQEKEAIKKAEENVENADAQLAKDNAAATKDAEADSKSAKEPSKDAEAPDAKEEPKAVGVKDEVKPDEEEKPTEEEPTQEKADTEKADTEDANENDDEGPSRT